MRKKLLLFAFLLPLILFGQTIASKLVDIEISNERPPGMSLSEWHQLKWPQYDSAKMAKLKVLMDSFYRISPTRRMVWNADYEGQKFDRFGDADNYLTIVRRPLPAYGDGSDTIKLADPYDSRPRMLVQLSQFEIGAVFVEKITISNRPVVLYKPSDFDPAKKYPVWVFLHGLSEMSRDKAEPDRVINNGNHAALLAAAEKYKFIVVAPQLVQNLNDWIPGWTNKYLQPVYDYIITNPFTDLTHIVVTGLSLGGGGTNVAMTGTFAPYVSAAIPICATPQYDQDFSMVARYNIPVWAFVAKDDVSFYTAQINTISAINKFSPIPEPKSTIYNSGGHSIWGQTYSTAELYTWALSQNNSPGPVALPPVIPIDSILSNYRLTIYKSGKVEMTKQ